MKKIIVLFVLACLISSVSLGFAADKKPEDKAIQKEIAAYTKAITANPNDAAAYVKRGKAYVGSNQLMLAMADYDQAIKLDPKHVQAYAARGAGYCETKQYEAALADYSRILEITPYDTEAHFRRGICYYYTQQYELGIGEVEQVIALQPNHAGAYLIKGVCCQKLERKAEAIEAYQSLLKNVSADKQTEEAIAAAKKMLKVLGVEL